MVTTALRNPRMPRAPVYYAPVTHCQPRQSTMPVSPTADHAEYIRACTPCNGATNDCKHVARIRIHLSPSTFTGITNQIDEKLKLTATAKEVSNFYFQQHLLKSSRTVCNQKSGEKEFGQT